MGSNIIPASRAFEILIEEIADTPMRADGAMNQNDLYIAVDKTWRRIREEEGK